MTEEHVSKTRSKASQRARDRFTKARALVPTLVRAAGKATGWGVKQMSEELGYDNHAKVSRWLSPDVSMGNAPLAVLLAWPKELALEVMRAIAKERGWVILKERDAQAVDLSLEQIGTLADVSGQTVATALRAAADGVIDPEEAAELEELYRELRALAASGEELCKQVLSGEGANQVSSQSDTVPPLGARH